MKKQTQFLALYSLSSGWGDELLEARCVSSLISLFIVTFLRYSVLIVQAHTIGKFLYL